MNSKSMTDFMKPTIITAQQYGTKISVEVDHSDLNLDEVMDAFQTLIIGLGYHENSFKNWVIDRAQEYNETDAEDLKQKLEAWKFEDDDIVLRHGYENRDELENDFFGTYDSEAEKRMNIIGQNGNDGLHYDKEGVDELLKRYNEPETQKRLNILRDAELGIKDGYRATDEDAAEFDDYGKRIEHATFEWGDEPEEDYDGQFDDWKNETPEDDNLFEGDEWKANENLKAANERYKGEVKKMKSKKRNNKD
jgi:hypothetical protein